LPYDVLVSNDFSDNQIPGSRRPEDDQDRDKPVREPLHHQPVSARVPERVGRGVYTTGQLVLDTPKEFVIDFLQGLTRPFQVAARVVVTPATMSEFAAALQTNLENYTRTFGPPPPMPVPPTDKRPTIQEIYENFKLPDELMSGSYANSVLIGHSPTEFFFDFITGFYPTPAVSARVLMPAAHVPKFLTTLRTCLEQYGQRHQARRPTKEPPQSDSNPD
jgi:hypothetical protein